jgi:hypothetical protein
MGFIKSFAYLGQLGVKQADDKNDAMDVMNPFISMLICDCFVVLFFFHF